MASTSQSLLLHLNRWHPGRSVIYSDDPDLDDVKGYHPGNDHISHHAKLGKSSTQKCQLFVMWESSQGRVVMAIKC